MYGMVFLQAALARYLFFCFLPALFLTLSGCASSSRLDVESHIPQSTARQGTEVSTGARRADPGYIQYLERLSMAGSQTELARVVSGSQLAWLRPAGMPFPDPLLGLADTWLSVNPLITVPETKRSVFASFATPMYWQILGKARIRGLYFNPVSGSGALWAYNRKASAKGTDTIQYTFSESAGSEDDYFRLLDASNKNRRLLGLELTPAATGLGPDFFLAARYHRQFSGIYCMVELPKKLWPSLPTTKDEWQVEPLSDAQTTLLARENLLPPAMTQDFLPTGKKGGWAVTGEIHGVDGLVRRWAYRFHQTPDQPVLNWEDPSTGARRILSGSVIRNVGILGSALVGMNMDGLYGLDATGPGSHTHFAPSPANNAIVAVSREVRRYGGWAWLKDATPISLTRDLMSEGPDFFHDHIFSPGIEHALLTGSTSLLEAMTDDALVTGLDMRRFVHATSGELGVSYELPHLAEVAAGNTSATILTPNQADDLRKNTLQEALHVIYAAKQDSPSGDDKPALQGKHLYSPPAGIAAMAIGVGNASSVTAEMEPLIREGHFLQVFLRAMLPGIFMISGQDMAGTLPLSWYAMTDSADGWDVSFTSRGAHAYTQNVPESAVTTLGIPRAKTLYSTPDIQLIEDNSFIVRLDELLAIRASYNVANATLYGRFETTAPGCFAYALILPANGKQNPADPQSGKIPEQRLPKMKTSSGDEAVLGASTTYRVGTATERQIRQHQETLQIRRQLEQRIVALPDLADAMRPGDAALIIVVNFSRETIRQVLNLYHDATLRRIRQKGAPALLTQNKSGKDVMFMSNGEQTITLTLPPWRCAAVLIGNP